MDTAFSPLPDNMEALKALGLESTRQVQAAVQRAAEAEAQLANARARESATEAVIPHLKLQIAKLKREQYGASAERTQRLLAQFELQLEDLEVDAAEDGLAAEVAAAKTANVTAFERKRPVRKPFPEHLPRTRVVVPAPCSCPACGSARLSKLGEDVTETLEVTPPSRSWPRARPISPDCGITSGMTVPLAARIHRPWCFTTPATGAANMSRHISHHGQGFCRPMPLRGTAISMLPRASPASSWRRDA